MDILDKQFQELDRLSQSLDDISVAIQLKLVQEIHDTGLNGQTKLLKKLIAHCSSYTYNITCVDGFIFELLLHSNDFNILYGLNEYCDNGIVPLKSDCNIDYSSLQKLLIKKEFQKADQLTQIKLCELSKILGNHSRDWLYFTDILEFPVVDLNTIDQLWNTYSRGLFGISIQRQVWLSSNLDWEKFLGKIGWKVNNVTCRYPKDFQWDITAPAGHLPLLNQLRGVHVMLALFSHPAWTNTIHNI